VITPTEKLRRFKIIVFIRLVIAFLNNILLIVLLSFYEDYYNFDKLMGYDRAGRPIKYVGL